MMFLNLDPDTRAPAVHLRNVFDPEGLKNMIKEITKQAPAEKGTHAEGDGIDSVDAKRKSTVRWFMDFNFEQHLRTAVDLANFNAGWRYDIVKSEMLQFTEYSPGGHYSWHTDGAGCHHSARLWQMSDKPQNLRETKDVQLLGTVRKISVSVILNDDYEGGELEFLEIDHNGELRVTKITPEIGSAIIFPSYINHRVTPVTKGTRYSVVAWYGGPPFK